MVRKKVRTRFLLFKTKILRVRKKVRTRFLLEKTKTKTKNK